MKPESTPDTFVEDNGNIFLILILCFRFFQIRIDIYYKVGKSQAYTLAIGNESTTTT